MYLALWKCNLLTPSHVPQLRLSLLVGSAQSKVSGQTGGEVPGRAASGLGFNWVSRGSSPCTYYSRAHVTPSHK
jgi:hypothetical protein